MIRVNENYHLNSESIEQIVSRIDEICQTAKVNSKDKVHISVAAEEMLNIWRERFGENQELKLTARGVLGRNTLELRCKNEESIDPCSLDESDSVFQHSGLRYLQTVPVYYYDSGWNCVAFNLRKEELSHIKKLLMVVLFSIIIGIIGKLILPENIITGLNEAFLNPSYDKFLEVLRGTAGMLVFFSVTWGIYGMGDTATLNRLGRGFIRRMMILNLVAAIGCMVFIPFFDLKMMGENANLTILSSFYQMILDMIPANIVEPFVQGNTLQVIFLAVLTGMSLLYLGANIRVVAVAVEQMNTLISFIMGLIGKLVPFFIAIVLVNLIWSGNVIVLGKAWKYIVILLIALVADMLILTLYTSVRQKVNPVLLVKKVFPAYLIALTTSSSAASFGTMLKSCEEDLGISSTMTNFGIPLGIILQKTADTINYLLIVFYISSVYEVALSPSKIMVAIIVSIFTAIATPPIPGGGTIAYTALFSQLGLPLEGLVITLALDMFTDFFLTSTEMFCMQVELVNIAGHFEQLDFKVLRN